MVFQDFCHFCGSLPCYQNHIAAFCRRRQMRRQAIAGLGVLNRLLKKGD
jgi:hypothetical protein